jgi:hypothetical protein
MDCKAIPSKPGRQHLPKLPLPSLQKNTRQIAWRLSASQNAGHPVLTDDFLALLQQFCCQIQSFLLLIQRSPSSEDIFDVNRAYEMGANSFLVKPHDFNQFVEACYVIKNYWLNLSKTPRISRPSTVEQPATTPHPEP